MKNKGHKDLSRFTLNKVNDVHPIKDDFSFTKDLIHYNQTDYKCTDNDQWLTHNETFSDPTGYNVH